MSQYKKGYISISKSSKIITGHNTSWLQNVLPGQFLVVQGFDVVFKVKTVNSDTQITLESSWPFPNVINKSYSIASDFTNNLKLFELETGDTQWAYLVKRNLRKIDSMLYAINASGVELPGTILYRSDIATTNEVLSGSSEGKIVTARDFMIKLARLNHFSGNYNDLFNIPDEFEATEHTHKAFEIIGLGKDAADQRVIDAINNHQEHSSQAKHSYLDLVDIPLNPNVTPHTHTLSEITDFLYATTEDIINKEPKMVVAPNKVKDFLNTKIVEIASQQGGISYANYEDIDNGFSNNHIITPYTLSYALTDLNEHKNKTDNPHGITKAAISLGNVDNTSDMDKPVSTRVLNKLSEIKDLSLIQDDDVSSHKTWSSNKIIEMFNVIINGGANNSGNGGCDIQEGDLILSYKDYPVDPGPEPEPEPEPEFVPEIYDIYDSRDPGKTSTQWPVVWIYGILWISKYPDSIKERQLGNNTDDGVDGVVLEIRHADIADPLILNLYADKALDNYNKVSFYSTCMKYGGVNIFENNLPTYGNFTARAKYILAGDIQTETPFSEWFSFEISPNT